MDQIPTSVALSLVAGGLAGASETFSTYPAEFVKTRLQLQISWHGKKPSSSFEILKMTYQTIGVKGIYAGCQTLAISNALKSAVRFFSFEVSKSTLMPYFQTKEPVNSTKVGSPWLNLCAGLCAGTTESILVVTPGEALKTKVINDTGSGGSLRSLSVHQLLSRTIREHGIRSLWNGLTPVLCKQGTNSAVRFTTFGALRDELSKRWPETIQGTTATMLAGAGSGVVTVYASMPFDNIKTRMQRTSSSAQRMTSVAAEMLRHEGVRVFWKATTSRLIRLTLSSTITFMVYDSAYTTLSSIMPSPLGDMTLMKEG